MNTYRFKFLVSVLFILTAACGRASTSDVTLTSGDVHPPLTRSTVTFTPAPASSTPMIQIQLSETVTPSPSKTPTVVASTFEKRCVPVVDLSQPNLMHNGNLIFYWIYAEGIGALSYQDQTPKLLLPGENRALPSPYTQTLLWFDAGLTYLWTEDSNEYVVNNSQDFRQWLADDRIILRGDLNIYGEEYPTIDEFYVFTPATGALEHYIIDFFEEFASPPSFPISRRQPLYDPYFKYAFYRWEEFVLENNVVVSDQDGVLLWDIHSGKEVWRAAGWGWPDVRAGASWKYDGSQVAYVAPDPAHDFSLELFSVSTSGLVSQLTNLGGTNAELYEIFDILWSPNGRYIAFLFNKDVIEPLESRYLYILDLDTGVVTDYCISPVWDMVWSPDSTQIAFLRNILGGPDAPPQLLVLDLEEQIAQDMNIETRGLYGWIDWDLP